MSPERQGDVHTGSCPLDIGAFFAKFTVIDAVESNSFSAMETNLPVPSPFRSNRPVPRMAGGD